MQATFGTVSWYLRILIDKSDPAALSLSESIEQKVKEWVPFSEMGATEIQALIDDAEDIGTLEKGRQEFNQLWLVGNKANTVYTGLESQGVCTCRLQLQGQRMVALVSPREVCDFYKTRLVNDGIKQFCQLDGDSGPDAVPDCWAMPTLSFEFVRTGDLVFCPAGMIVVEKAVETSISVRQDHVKQTHLLVKL